MADLNDLLDLAESLARDAGRLLLDGIRRVHDEVATKSSLTDMVSEMDRASEELIVEGILAARPHDGILAEEGSSRDGTSGVRWIIDPLDGTTNYLYRHFAWAVSIAAEVDGVVEAGVVADPSHREVFSAVRGKGAWCNGEPIAVSGTTDLRSALVATGFGYSASRRAAQALVLPRLLPAVRDIRRNGAAALDFCWVANGRVDAYFEYGSQPWDAAAGLLIATEAGATAAGLDGGPPRAESAMVATPGVADALLELLVEAGAEVG